MITLENFEHHVSFKIWQRGMDYYEDGAVAALEETLPGEWTATVEGAECYTVKVLLDGDEVEAWECDCPYDMGDICKHVVAVVIAIRKEREKGNGSVVSKKKTQKKKAVVVEEMKSRAEEAVTVGEERAEKDDSLFADLMKLAKKEDLSTFIEAYAMNDEQFKQVFLDYLIKKFVKPKEKIRKNYRKEVMRVFMSTIRTRRSRYSYRNDYDEDTDWTQIAAGMKKLFDEALILLKAGETKSPTDIILQFYQSLMETINDSFMYDYGGLGMMADCCEKAAEILRNVVVHPSASSDLRRGILSEIGEMAEGSVWEECFDFDMDGLKFEISRLVQTPEGHLKMLDEEIGKQTGVSRYVIMKMDYLDELGRTEEAQTVMNQYLHLPEVRRRKVEQLQGEEKYVEALELLNDGIVIAKQNNHAGTERQWLEMKLAIYELQKSSKEIIEICRTLFVANSGSMEYYKKLKENIPPDEWKTFLHRMIAKVKYRSGVIADIFEAEKEYDELLKWIISESYNRISRILNYGLRMPKNYHSALLDLFAVDIKAYTENKFNIGREHYRTIAQWLHEAKRFTGGTMVVARIVGEFRTTYKRRPAMMEELRGL